MMEWILMLGFFFNGEAVYQQSGIMLDEDSCIIAGAGMSQVLEAANPGLTVVFTCTYAGQSS
jgi:hypothetical protein